MMSILVLAPSLAGHGGIARYVDALLRAWSDPPANASIRVVELAADLTPVARATFAAKAALAAVRRPDLIVAAHVGLAPTARLLARLVRRPYWVLTYGIDVWGDVPPSKARSLRDADRVVAISEYTREQVLQRTRADAARALVLPCALDGRLQGISPDDAALDALGVPRGGYVLTVARLAAQERYKGHDRILRALGRIRSREPVRYVIVGDGDDRERLQALALTEGVADRVTFTGPLDDAALAAAYRRCAVFAMPAQTAPDGPTPKGEGFGIVFLEAMLFGKPVVGPDVGAPTEFIRHKEHGLLVPADDVDAIAQALGALIGDPEAARAMGEAGRARVLSEHSYERFRDRAQALLTQHTGGRA